MEPRRKYSQEFKQEAVQLIKQAGGGITQVARDLAPFLARSVRIIL